MSELLEVEPVAAGESGAEVDAEGGCHGAEGEAEGEDAGLAHRPTFASSRAPRWSEPSVSGRTVSFRRRSPCVTGQSMSRAPCVPLAGVLPLPRVLRRAPTLLAHARTPARFQLGRASCRGRVCQYV